MTRHWSRRVAARVGRRGAALLFVAILSAATAWGLAFPTPEILELGAYRTVTRALPTPVWLAIWVATGTACVVQAFSRRDRAAFSAVTAVMAGWGIVHTAGAVTGIDPRGWVAGALYLSFGLLYMLIATWPEPPDNPEVRRD